MKLSHSEKITLGISIAALIFAIPSIVLSIWTYNAEYSESLSIDVSVVDTGYKTIIDTTKTSGDTELKLFLAFECTLLNNSNRKTTLMDIRAMNLTDNFMFYNFSNDINMISRLETPLSIDGRGFIKFFIFCPILIEGKAKSILLDSLSQFGHSIDLSQINELLYKHETDLMNNEVKNRAIYIYDDKKLQITFVTSENEIIKQFGFYSRGR